MGFSRTSIAAFRAALLVALLAISYLAFSDRAFPAFEPFSDKWRHFAAFAALALLVDFSFPARRFGPAKILVLLGYGAAIEAVQYFLPYREASALDVLADALGVAAFVVSVPLMKRMPWFRLRWQSQPSP